MPALTLRFLVVALLTACSLLPVRAMGQSCPTYVPHPGPQSLDIWLTKPSNNNCAVTDGTYILKGSVLRLDALGTAYGYCERWYPLPAPCHVIATYQRNMADIDAWATTPTGQWFSSVKAKDSDGFCKIGIAHEIDSRSDPTQQCGFNSFVAQADSDYTIRVEGDIQPTPCSMTPVNTEIETISFHSRCALSRGGPCNGTLLGGGGKNPLSGNAG